jgi:tetratricopeptide (TPR) repeat protein
MIYNPVPVDPVEKYLAYFNENKHEEAMEVYNSEINENDEMMEQLSEEQNEKMDDIYNKFQTGDITYDASLEQINIYMEYDASKTYATNIQKKIDSLNSSNNSYMEAEEASNSGDIIDAITKYKAVIKDDTNYENAQNRIGELQEQYKTELLDEAQNYADNKQYDEAIKNINSIISNIGTSDELTNLKQKYTQMKSEQYVKVVVSDKSVTPQDSSNWIFSNYVNFVFDVTNNCDKEIKGIEGTLTVYDLFEKEIISIECDFTGQIIQPGQTYTEKDLSFECNEFIDSHMKLFNTDYSDLVFNYDVTSIVFSDGTTLKPE